jgi:hypothetical protein
VIVTDRYCHSPIATWDRDAATPEVPGLLVSRARDILCRVDDSFPWPADDRGSVLMACYELEETLDVHALLRTGELHPASEFPDLEGETEALEIALERVSEDISDWAGALVAAVREYCGEEVAAYVNGGHGSTSEQ